MKVLPDIMIQQSKLYQKLEWVGMTDIQLAMLVGSMAVPVSLDVGVNLIEGNRGIHMSRLYQLQQSLLLNKPLSQSLLNEFSQRCLESQADISQFVSAKIKFQWPLATQSLKSGLPGFRQYPSQFIIESNGIEFKTWFQFEVLYSSTCPQSASVAMEVMKADQILQNQSGQTLERFAATPHAQRSVARIQVHLKKFDQSYLEQLIFGSEACLGTPVQTTVKKVDEMEFAKLNAQNLMFCEDASRKLSAFLTQQYDVLGCRVSCEHQESLHPHNATSLSVQNYSSPQTLSFT